MPERGTIHDLLLRRTDLGRSVKFLVISLLHAFLAATIFTSLLLSVPLWAGPSQPEVSIYVSSRCQMCEVYLVQEVFPLLKEAGFERGLVIDLASGPNAAADYIRVQERSGIPRELWAHMAVFANRLVLEGMPPAALIREALEHLKQDPSLRLVLFQDEMHGGTSYKVWAFHGPVREYPIGTPVGRYLLERKVGAGVPRPNKGDRPVVPITSRPLFLLAIAGGFADSLTPCNAAGLLLFLAVLFALQRTRMQVMTLGGVAVAGVFITYFLLGFGFLQGLSFIGRYHLVSTLGAAGLILVGLWTLADGAGVPLPLRPRIPQIGWHAMGAWMRRGSGAGAFVFGSLLGICALPCSGGTYVSILAILGSQATRLIGLGYLTLYNLIFVSPLVVILLLVGNRHSAEKLRAWQLAHARSFKITAGAVMTALGTLVLWLL